MDTFYTFVVAIAISAAVVASQLEGKQQCHVEAGVERCYWLYRGVTTWSAAYDLCLQDDKTLAVVNSSATQRVMEKLAVDQQTSVSHAWIAGRRDVTSTTWTDLSGSDVPAVTGSPWSESDQCATYRPKTNTLVGRQCGTGGSDRLLYVCQYSVNSQGQCSSPSHHQEAGLCYTLSAVGALVWTDAYQYCITNGMNARLGYSALRSASLKSYLLAEIDGSTLDVDRDDPEVWVGVYRKPWAWVTGAPDSPAYTPIDFSSWWDQEGSGESEDCLHLDLQENAQWSDKRCEETSQYYVCETATPITTTGPSTKPTTPQTTTPTTTTTTTQKPDTTSEKTTPTSTQSTPSATPQPPTPPPSSSSPTSVTSSTPAPSSTRAPGPSTPQTTDNGGRDPPVPGVTSSQSTESSSAAITKATGSPDESTQSEPNTLYIIIGAACGGAVFVIVIIVVAVCCCKRKKKPYTEKNDVSRHLDIYNEYATIEGDTETGGKTSTLGNSEMDRELNRVTIYNPYVVDNGGVVGDNGGFVADSNGNTEGAKEKQTGFDTVEMSY